MGRTRDPDGVKSNLIISEVQRRPCLFDTNDPNYGDRTEKTRCWQEVYESVVPGWLQLGVQEKFVAGKEVQKRWRSIRDSYTKAYRQGKCVAPEMSAPGTRRYQYHKQMAFLFKALQNKKPRYAQDKYESFSEVSNSPSHTTSEDVQPKMKSECLDKPLDLKTKPDVPEKPETMDKSTATIDNEVDLHNTSVEIKIDANSILPEDHFNDDRLFMNSLLPLFTKMDDDTRLLCRIEVLKIIRFALQGHKDFQALRMAEDSLFTEEMANGDASDSTINTTKSSESKLSMVTRSADGTRTTRKRKDRSPTPLAVPAKKRGPGRPRKIRLPQSADSDEELARKRLNEMSPMEPRLSEMEEALNKATSVTQLPTPLFMKIYNLGRSKTASTQPQTMQVSVKTEPMDPEPQPS